jgi:hypothetical protein
MKRKGEEEHSGMKLRSGKIIRSSPRELPKELNDELETELQNFKKLFSNNKKHAKEVLKIITKASSINSRVDIREKIEEAYNEDESDISSLQGAAGDLAWLIIGNSSFYKEHNIIPKYHDLIQARIQNFDLETPILGEVEDLP